MGFGSLISRTAVRRMTWLMSTALLSALAGAVAYDSSAAAPPANAAPAEMSAAAVSAAVAQQPGSSSDFFLTIDGIEGESGQAGHKGEIEILSWSFGVSQTSSHGAGGGGGAGKVSMQDFHFTAHVSKASPKLFLSCATGQHIKEAKLTVRKAGGGQQEYLVIKLSDVLITSYQVGASEGDAVPTDQVSINFTKIEYEYRPQSADGTASSPVRVQYDVKAAKGN